MKSKNCVLLLLLMLMFSTIAFSQGRTISGKVVDNSGQGIVFALVVTDFFNFQAEMYRDHPAAYPVRLPLITIFKT